MIRERFRDSGAILDDYIWEINHNEEKGQQQSRSIERTAVTSGVGFVRQQGVKSPLLLEFSGTILTQSQLDAMRAYFRACDTRTIFFRGVSGEEHEVLITDLNIIRHRVLRNPRSTDPWIWTYDITMEVIS